MLYSVNVRRTRALFAILWYSYDTKIWSDFCAQRKIKEENRNSAETQWESEAERTVCLWCDAQRQKTDSVSEPSVPELCPLKGAAAACSRQQDAAGQLSHPPSPLAVTEASQQPTQCPELTAAEPGDHTHYQSVNTQKHTHTPLALLWY